MKNLTLYVMCLALLFGLAGCGKSKYVFESEKPYYGMVTDCAMSVVSEGDRVGRAYVEVIKELFSVVEEEDTHGGFHGDGTYFLALDCSQNKEVAKELVNSWTPFPLSKNLNTILYGSASYSSLLDEETNIPEITNGYYYFCDRHLESTDASDDTDLFHRASYNFTLMIYDSDTDRLYYVEFDT